MVVDMCIIAMILCVYMLYILLSTAIHKTFTGLQAYWAPLFGHCTFFQPTLNLDNYLIT